MRHVLPLLVFAAVTAGQGVDDWIETALDPRTAPEQRVEALKKVAQSKEALDRLAEKGLDSKRDPEVVHAVVDTLLKASDYRPYLERMSRLLLSEKHRDKVLRRFQSVWEADRGQPLLEFCMTMARETTDPLLKEAAILALSKIPRRRAAETIVEVGLAAPDEPVRNAARVYVQRWFGLSTLREAAAFLQQRRLDSFQDLVEARIDALIAKEKENEDRTRRFLGKATAAEALEELERGGAYRLFAAQRLATLAEENGIKDTAEFARRILNGVVAELSSDSPDPRVLAPLLAALQHYSDPSGALWQTTKPKDVRDTIQRLADLQGSGPEHQDVGSNAVRILGAIDDEGIALNAFAERFPSVDVKKAAIQQLGQLAHSHPEQRNYVGIKLAALLVGAEKEPAIRAQILNLLTQPHVPVATEPADVVKVVRGYLEKGASPDLTDAELRDCTIVLGKRRTPEAREALFKAASSHEKVQVRRYALEEGLVPWARADESIHEQLKALALAKDQQPFEARKAVIEALGKRGGRRAEATLRAIGESEELDPQLVPVVREARLQLLKRLANGEGAAADSPDQKPADLEAAGRLLEQEVLGDPDPDAERMEPLAALLVKMCDAAKQPAYTARYRLAWFYAHLPAPKGNEAQLLERYEGARANAAADRLPPALREAMLKEYRELLLKVPDDKERVARAVRCTADLAELALDGKDRGKAASCYLDAAECAYRLLGNGPLAMDLLDKAKTSGGLGGELVAREADLRAKVEQLPKPS